MQGRIRGLLIAGLIISAVFVSHLVISLIQVYGANKNIWWTPKSMMLSFKEIEGKLEIYINDKPFKRYLEEGGLLIKDNSGDTHQIEAKNIGIRLNNWPSIKSVFLERVVRNAFGAGLGLAFLISGLYLHFSLKKREK